MQAAHGGTHPHTTRLGGGGIRARMSQLKLGTNGIGKLRMPSLSARPHESPGGAHHSEPSSAKSVYGSARKSARFSLYRQSSCRTARTTGRARAYTSDHHYSSPSGGHTPHRHNTSRDRRNSSRRRLSDHNHKYQHPSGNSSSHKLKRTPSHASEVDDLHYGSPVSSRRASPKYPSGCSSGTNSRPWTPSIRNNIKRLSNSESSPSLKTRDISTPTRSGPPTIRRVASHYGHGSPSTPVPPALTSRPRMNTFGAGQSGHSVSKLTHSVNESPSQRLYSPDSASRSSARRAAGSPLHTYRGKEPHSPRDTGLPSVPQEVQD